MNFEREDDLERALFALPLEEPPPGMRAAILAATVYRPAIRFSAWEVWGMGTLGAFSTWLLWLIISAGPARFVQTFVAFGKLLASPLGNPTVILWASLGIAAAVCVSFLSFPPPQRIATRR